MNSTITRLLIYSITGMIINKLNNTKETKVVSLNLPEFKGILEVKHALGGRLRFYIPSIKVNIEKSNYLIDNFRKIDGITLIESNPLTGSVLVKYDQNKLQPVLIMGIILKLLGLEDEIKKGPKSLVTKEVQNIRDAVNFAVYNKSKGIIDMKNIAMLSFIILGVYKLNTNPGLNISGATSLWWAYSFIKNVE